MKIKAIRLFRYDLPLLSPLKMKGKILKQRTGFLLQLIESSGQYSYGEIAPFPNLHLESLSEAKQQLSKLSILPQKESYSEKTELLLEELTQYFAIQKIEFFPSVRFGIEMAFLNLLARLKKTSPASLLTPTPSKIVYINGLVAGANPLKEAKRLAEEGYKAIKVKVGLKPLQEEIETIQNIRETIGPTCKLRLDANQKWSLAQGIEFGKAMTTCGLEYIEEPLENPKELANLYKETQIPIALDESLSEESLYSELLGVKALVLKPSVFGSVLKLKQWTDFANKHRLESVISSTFHSGIGLTFEANLAACYSKETPAGLDTYKWFQEDLLKKRFQANKGQIDVAVINQNSDQLLPHLIQEITAKP